MYKIYTDGELFCDSRADDLAIINPVVKLTANKAGSFTFTIPPTHPYYDAISERTTIIDVYRGEDTEPLFEGICTEYEDDFYGQRDVTCEGELTFFNDTILRQAHYEGLTSRQLLETYVAEHNSYVEAFKRFEVGMVTAKDSNDSITCYTNYNSTMKEIKEDLIDDIGGYFRIRHEDGKRILDYLADSPRTNSQIIKLGENLLDYTSNLDSSDLITCIIPLGARLDEEVVEGLASYTTIESVNDGKDYLVSEDAVASFGRIDGVVNWDDVTIPANLKEKAEKYLTEAQFADITIEIKAIDLHYDEPTIQSFRMLDKVRIVSKHHGMDKYFTLTQMTINLNNPEKDTFTFGSTEKATMSAKNASANTAILDDIEKRPTADFLQSAIANATALITGAEGGHIKINFDATTQEPAEILIMDTDDASTATKIWRWNQNGLGYSSNGGKTYGLAMTKDGQIVADYIKSGTLQSITLKSNTISGGSMTSTSITSASITSATISSSSLSSSTIQSSAFHLNNSTLGTNDTHSQLTYQSASATWYLYSTGGAYFGRDLDVAGAFYASGTKSRIVDTDDYGDVLQYCLETPSPMFEDIGDGQIQDGECQIFLDDQFAETIDTDCDYQVFLQKYGEGDVWVAERTPTYFSVKGTEGLQFGWRIVAVQKNYDGYRLEPYDDENDSDLYEDGAIEEDDTIDILDYLLETDEEEEE